MFWRLQKVIPNFQRYIPNIEVYKYLKICQHALLTFCWRVCARRVSTLNEEVVDVLSEGARGKTGNGRQAFFQNLVVKKLYIYIVRKTQPVVFAIHLILSYDNGHVYSFDGNYHETNTVHPSHLTVPARVGRATLSNLQNKSICIWASTKSPSSASSRRECTSYSHKHDINEKTSSSSYSNFFWVAPNKNHPSNKTSKKPCGRRRDQPLYVIWIRLVQMRHQTTNLAKVCSQLHFATYDFPYLRSLMGLMPCMKKDRQTPALNLSFITAMSFKMSTWNLKNIWRSMDLSRPIWWTEDPLLHDHSHSLVVAIMILGSFKKTTLPWELRSRAELVWRG